MAGADGAWFLGTGNDGKVIKVDRNGQGSLFYDSTEMEVHALRRAPNGGLYVGTSPDGRIYRVDAKGQATTFFDPDDKYIWSLVVDRDGNVFAGTGDKGTVYKITPDGKGARFFASKTAHAVSLAFDQNRQLLVGTGAPGRVFRVDAAGKGFLLLDTTYQEIHAIRVDPKGVIYAAAQSGRAQGRRFASGDAMAPPPVTPSIPNVSTEITSITVVDVGAAQAGAAPSSGERRGTMTGAVYRVQPDGLWDELWTAKDDAPYDIAIEPDGAMLVATGAKGKLFRLSGDPVSAVLLTRVPAQQATMIARDGDRTVHRDRQSRTADVGLDGSRHARHLRVRREGRAPRIDVGRDDLARQRAGRHEGRGLHALRQHQDAGRSVERVERAVRERRRLADHESEGALPAVARRADRHRHCGAGADVAVVGVPAAQHPAAGRRRSPFIRPASSSRSRSRAAKPRSPGSTRMRRTSAASANNPAGVGAPPLGRRIFQRGLQTFAWKADDDNNDELSYDVFYRREGDTAWRTLEVGSARHAARVGHELGAERHLRAEGAGLGSQVESRRTSRLAASSKAAASRSTTSRRVVQIGALRRDGTRLIVPAEVRDTDSAGDEGRVLTRRAALAAGVSARRHPRRPAGGVRDPSRGGRGRTDARHSRDRCVGECRDRTGPEFS